jgi:hypothetical protein
VTPDKKRRRSPDTGSVDTILVEFVAEMVPHDSPEFRERAKLAAARPIPDYLKPPPKPENPDPPAGP